MSRSRTVLIVAVSALLGVAVAPTCDAAETKFSFSISGDGTVSADPAVVPEPANCIGPLSLVNASISLSNGTMVAENAVVTATLTSGLHFDSNADCVVTSGTCMVTSATTLQWTVTVPALSIEFARFTPRVDADVPLGSQICETVSAVIDGGSPVVATACATTNSARQCGLGAPAVSETSVVLLILALAAGGMLLLSRRRS